MFVAILGYVRPCFKKGQKWRTSSCSGTIRNCWNPVCGSKVFTVI